MYDPKTGRSYTDEEAERRAREAIRRSFQMPYKPQKEMVGKSATPHQPMLEPVFEIEEAVHRLRADRA